MEPLQIDLRRHGKVEAITLRGPLVLGTPVRELEAKLNNLFAHSTFQIILDLEGVARLDSSGIGLLMQILQHSNSGGGSLKLVKPSKQVTLALKMCHVLTLFEVYKTCEEAILAFDHNVGTAL